MNSSTVSVTSLADLVAGPTRGSPCNAAWARMRAAGVHMMSWFAMACIT